MTHTEEIHTYRSSCLPTPTIAGSKEELRWDILLDKIADALSFKTTPDTTSYFAVTFRNDMVINRSPIMTRDQVNSLVSTLMDIAAKKA